MTKHKRERMMPFRCECCNTTLVEGECPSCALYNAAVAAQKAGAMSIAQSREPTARDAWLNEYGVFAYDSEGTCRLLGSPEEAAPFVALTSAARGVTTFLAPSLKPSHRVASTKL